MRLQIACVSVATVACALGLIVPAQATGRQTCRSSSPASARKGADLGGLDGADAHCQALARAAGSTETNWRAYPGTSHPGGDAGVNARDRIGKGPWQNAKGIVIAKTRRRPTFG